MRATLKSLDAVTIETWCQLSTSHNSVDSFDVQKHGTSQCPAIEMRSTICPAEEDFGPWINFIELWLVFRPLIKGKLASQLGG